MFKGIEKVCFAPSNIRIDKKYTIIFSIVRYNPLELISIACFLLASTPLIVSANTTNTVKSKKPFIGIKKEATKPQHNENAIDSYPCLRRLIIIVFIGCCYISLLCIIIQFVPSLTSVTALCVDASKIAVTGLPVGGDEKGIMFEDADCKLPEPVWRICNSFPG